MRTIAIVTVLDGILGEQDGHTLSTLTLVHFAASKHDTAVFASILESQVLLAYALVIGYHVDAPCAELAWRKHRAFIYLNIAVDASVASITCTHVTIDGINTVSIYAGVTSFTLIDVYFTVITYKTTILTDM